MKGKILIVDDEEASRRTLGEILRLEGYHVADAANGQAAVEAIENEDYDLMLLDLKMPGMSGLDVLEQVVQILPGCKVIMLTAHGSLESAIEALRHGAHDYISKPAAPHEIIASVAKGITVRTESDRKRR